MHVRIPDALIAGLVLQGLRAVAAASIAIGDTFGLYAYGNGITGLPILYRDGEFTPVPTIRVAGLLLTRFAPSGTAVIADFTTANESENLVPVTCRHTVPLEPRVNVSDQVFPVTASAGALKGGFVFSASPNRTAPVENAATSEPPFASARWSVPARDSTSRNVEFVNGPEVPRGLVAQGFQLFTHQVMLQESTGKVLESLYCAFSTDTPGVWSLSWNTTGTNKGGVRVVLRDSPPPPGVRYTVIEGQTCGHTD